MSYEQPENEAGYKFELVSELAKVSTKWEFPFIVKATYLVYNAALHCPTVSILHVVLAPVCLR